MRLFSFSITSWLRLCVGLYPLCTLTPRRCKCLMEDDYASSLSLPFIDGKYDPVSAVLSSSSSFSPPLRGWHPQQVYICLLSDCSVDFACDLAICTSLVTYVGLQAQRLIFDDATTTHPPPNMSTRPEKAMGMYIVLYISANVFQSGRNNPESPEHISICPFVCKWAQMRRRWRMSCRASWARPLTAISHRCVALVTKGVIRICR